MMEEEKEITTSLKKLDLNSNIMTSSPSKSSLFSPALQSPGLLSCRRRRPGKSKPPSLLSLCLGVVGKNLQDIIAHLSDISIAFPPHIKMTIVAIARRRRMLCDEVIIPLADTSWEILDISGSEVTDSGLIEVTKTCKFLRAVDISRCNKITASSVSVLVEHCKSLQTLRCGGCPRSDYTARCCLTLLKPKLDDMVGDSWEELDTAEISHNAESLHWLVWPNIDKDSLEIMATECPRISVNPKRSPFGFRGKDIPIEAFPDTALDDLFVQEINPSTWAASGFTLKPVSPILSNSKELSLAEKFRLAFVERDTRLAPKRAKNARQHQRRSDREWMTMSAEAKAIVLASQVSKSLHGRN
ncbi:hypothetical protein NC652_027911 [Populus alba x Populus x berolinensis]|nr:hypothetical protein NC652_027911 [Populus alba x Populus x berolinensis]